MLGVQLVNLTPIDLELMTVLSLTISAFLTVIVIDALNAANEVVFVSALVSLLLFF